jgi:hypothetical protein
MPMPRIEPRLTGRTGPRVQQRWCREFAVLFLFNFGCLAQGSVGLQLLKVRITSREYCSTN